MIKRPITNILHQHPLRTPTRLHTRRRTRCEIPMRARRCPTNRRARALSRKPNNHTLPVVSVARGDDGVRLVFGPVPRVHDAEGAVVCSGAAVHLARAAGTGAGGGAGWLEAGAGRGVSEGVFFLEGEGEGGEDEVRKGGRREWEGEGKWRCTWCCPGRRRRGRGRSRLQHRGRACI